MPRNRSRKRRQRSSSQQQKQQKSIGLNSSKDQVVGPDKQKQTLTTVHQGELVKEDAIETVSDSDPVHLQNEDNCVIPLHEVYSKIASERIVIEFAILNILFPNAKFEDIMADRYGGGGWKDLGRSLFGFLVGSGSQPQASPQAQPSTSTASTNVQRQPGVPQSQDLHGGGQPAKRANVGKNEPTPQSSVKKASDASVITAPDTKDKQNEAAPVSTRAPRTNPRRKKNQHQKDGSSSSSSEIPMPKLKSQNQQPQSNQQKPLSTRSASTKSLNVATSSSLLSDQDQIVFLKRNHEDNENSKAKKFVTAEARNETSSSPEVEKHKNANKNDPEVDGGHDEVTKVQSEFTPQDLTGETRASSSSSLSNTSGAANAEEVLPELSGVKKPADSNLNPVADEAPESEVLESNDELNVSEVKTEVIVKEEADKDIIDDEKEALDNKIDDVLNASESTETIEASAKILNEEKQEQLCAGDKTDHTLDEKQEALENCNDNERDVLDTRSDKNHDDSITATNAGDKPSQSSIPIPPPPPPPGFLAPAFSNDTIAARGKSKTRARSSNSTSSAASGAPGSSSSAAPGSAAHTAEIALLKELETLNDPVFANFLKTQLNVKCFSRDRAAVQEELAATSSST